MPMISAHKISAADMLAIPAVEFSNLERLPATPLVSVLMITYNHEKYVARAIEGVLAQRCDFPMELIIGEDYSTDSTLKICKEYQTQHPNLIRLITGKNNVGVNPNLLRVWGRCKGNYIAICEGDDFWIDPFKLAKQVQQMEAHPEYSMSFTRAQRTQQMADGSLVSVSISGPLDNKDAYSQQELVQDYLAYTCTLLLRRELLDGFPKWFPDIFNADVALQFIFTQHGQAGFISEVTAIHLLTGNGISSSLTSQRNHLMRLHTWTTLRRYNGEEASSVLDREILDRAFDYASLTNSGMLRRKCAEYAIIMPLKRLTSWTKRKLIKLATHFSLIRVRSK